MRAAFSVVGVVLVNERPQKSGGQALTGKEFPTMPWVAAEEVQTVDVLALIAAYQDDEGHGRFLPPLHP